MVYTFLCYQEKSAFGRPLHTLHLDVERLINAYYMRVLNMIEEHKISLINYLDFLKEEINAYPKFYGLTGEEYQNNKDIRKDVEKWIENIIDYSVNIGKILLCEYKMPVPDTYKEILYNLKELPMFTEEFSQEIAKWSVLKNIVDHKYINFKWDNIKDFVKESEKTYVRLVDKVQKLLVK